MNKNRFVPIIIVFAIIAGNISHALPNNTNEMANPYGPWIVIKQPDGRMIMCEETNDTKPICRLS